jgi:hypothetical protein
MTRIAQARPSWLLITTIGFATALMFAPTAAWAGSAKHDHDAYRAYGAYDSHPSEARHRHAAHKRYERIDDRRYQRALRKMHKHGRRLGHEKNYVGFYCEPCNRAFSARRGLYDHVGYRHQVPFRDLSLAISFGSFGWIFFG